MPASLQLAFAQPHEEAIAFIRGKPAVTRAVFDRLLPELRARAFTVTGIDEFDRLQRIRDVISDLPAGATWDETKAELMTQLDALGDGAERRAELLLRTHGFQAFQAANWNVAQADEDTTHLQYLATEDDRVRDTHLALNGVIVPKNDPFWNRHFPPWEWGCRCRVRPINPDLLAEARQQDAGMPPERHLVIEGPALQRLRDGQIIRDNRTYDVTAPADRRDGDKAFQWSPGDLHLDAAKLETRYDPTVWSQWKDWARTTEVRPGTTVWEWLGQAAPRSKTLPLAAPTAAPILSPSSPARQVPPGLPAVSQGLRPQRMTRPMRSAIDLALQAIDQLHGDGVLPKIPVKSSATKEWYGVFRHGRGVPIEIAVAKAGDHYALTLVHEVGHFLDLSAIGGPGAMESAKGAAGLLGKVLAAAAGSAAVKTLEAMSPSLVRSYYLRLREIWARAYAQWVAQRSGNPVLLDELAKTRSKVPGVQWDEADFAAIGAAIDELFRDLGWRL